MEKRIVISAIALVTAGLLVTSATGLNVSTQMVPYENEQITNDLKNIDKQSVIDTFVAHPELFKEAEYVQRAPISSSRMTVESAGGIETVEQCQQTMPCTVAQMSVPEQTRDSYTLLNTHPGLADRLMHDHLFLTYESFFRNESIPVEEEGVCYTWSFDNGENWTDPIFFVDESMNVLERSQPSCCYWGQEGLNDVWYATYRPAPPPQEETGWIPFIRFVGTIPEPLYWDFSTSGYSDLTEPQIDCTDAWPDYFWGVMTFAIRSGGQLRPGFFYQANDMGWGSLTTFVYTATGSNDVSIDMYDEASVLMSWGIYWYGGQSQKCWLVYYTDVPEFTPQYVWGWVDPIGHWWFDNPSVATYNGALLTAMEGFNHTIDPDGQQRALELIKMGDREPGTIDVGWEYTWDEGTFVYPEIEHVEGETYICTVLGVNRSDLTDSKIYITMTTDAGMSWTDLYYLSGDDIAIEHYRGIEISKGGNMAIWEYVADPFGNPNDDVISLHLEYLTVELNGQVKYEEGLPVSPCEVYITNLDPDYGFTVQANTDGGNYWMKLFVGFDIWPDAEFKLLGMDANDHSDEGIELYTFTDVPPFIITNDIIVYYLPGDLDHSGCVNLSDLAQLLGNYGECGKTYEEGDINGDGCVTLSDLAALLGSYGDCLP